MDYLRNFLASLFLTDRLFYAGGALVVLFVGSFWLPWLFFLPVFGLVLLLGALGYDIYQLYQGRVRLFVNRRLPKVLSLGDEARIQIHLANLSPLPLRLTITDELPVQLQVRDQAIAVSLAPAQRRRVDYLVRPTHRGAHQFGNINLFLRTDWGLAERRIQHAQEAELPVYPSIVQMKKYELRALDPTVPQHGMKKMRRIGQSYEFDQIKNYVRGDDYRSINWRATGRRGELMVNQYEDERAQQIYCVIDKSRSMLMPFNELSLLDYAVNAALALSNVVLRKHDRAGLLTFSDRLGTILKADSKSNQLQKIIQALYREKERDLEANYELLYYAVRKFIRGRSLILLFANFESEYALQRAMPVLRRIHAAHLLVVVFFENTEIRDGLDVPITDVAAVYQTATARQFLTEKTAMVSRLRQYGIQAVLTRPEDLTADTINKYLELKTRGLI